VLKKLIVSNIEFTDVRIFMVFKSKPYKTSKRVKKRNAEGSGG